MAKMSDLLKYIKKTNKAFINAIIEIIRDDKDWLLDLGISESELKNKSSISNLIRKKILIPTNSKSIDLLLRYVISDYLIDDHYDIPLIRHEVSADGYGKTCALFVFKCSEIYLCYFYDDEMETLITEDPEEFCWDAAATINKNYELEEDNLTDDWFKDSVTYNDLLLNFNFNKS